jgi:hypothetical protein
LNIKCVFWFSLQLLPETFLILRRTEQDIITNVRRSSCKVPRYSSQILIKLEFSWKIFQKSSNIKFRQNPSCGSRVVPHGQRQTDRQTDRHDKANSCFSEFCERA